MFSTMPLLSSVWNVQATSAGTLARKLVSGLPSGSSGCLPSVGELAHGELAEDADAFLRVAGQGEVACFLRDSTSLTGSRTRMRTPQMSLFSYRPASAPCSTPVARGRSATASSRHCCLRSLGFVGDGRDRPGRHDAAGIALALVQARLPTSPNGVPSGRCGDALPSLRCASTRRLVDPVDPLVRHQRPRPQLLVLRVVLDQQHLRRVVDRPARLHQVDARVVDRRRLVLRRPTAAPSVVSRWLSGARRRVRHVAEDGAVADVADLVIRPDVLRAGEERQVRQPERGEPLGGRTRTRG